MRPTIRVYFKTLHHKFKHSCFRERNINQTVSQNPDIITLNFHYYQTVGGGGKCISKLLCYTPLLLSLFSLNWSLGNSLTLVCYETETTRKRIIRRKPLNSSYSKTQAAPFPPLPTGRKAPLISLLRTSGGIAPTWH